MDIDRRLLDEALQTLGEVLEARGIACELVAIGGSSLMLLGLISRPTRDLDAPALVEHGVDPPNCFASACPQASSEWSSSDGMRV